MAPQKDYFLAMHWMAPFGHYFYRRELIFAQFAWRNRQIWSIHVSYLPTPQIVINEQYLCDLSFITRKGFRIFDPSFPDKYNPPFCDIGKIATCR